MTPNGFCSARSEFEMFAAVTAKYFLLMIKRYAHCLTLIATLALFLTGCSRSTEFSTVLEGGFDPAAAFRQHGYAVQTDARGEGIRNSPHGYGWGSWCGIVTDASEPAPCNALAVVIRDELNTVLSGTSLDELTAQAQRPEGQPLTGMLRYNKGSVHGDMHVWLTPMGTNSIISYVIFLREERLN